MPSEVYLTRKVQRPSFCSDSSKGQANATAIGLTYDVDNLNEQRDVLQDELEQWRRCSGLHTVEEWVLNYKKHPAGWAALLMIHGIPEVTGRLRSKVENYSIYSALFLSFSIPTVMDPPEPLWECDQPGCLVSKYVFFGMLSFAVAAHMLSILLGMSFVNALNEAPLVAHVIPTPLASPRSHRLYQCSPRAMVGATPTSTACLPTARASMRP